MNKLLYIPTKRMFFLMFIWGSFFLSINLNPLDFNTFSFFEKLRILLPSILVIIFLFLEFKNYKLTNFNNLNYIFFFNNIFFIFLF